MEPPPDNGITYKPYKRFLPAADPMLSVPLTLEAMEAGAVVTFTNKAAGLVTYKVNDGAIQTITSNTAYEITLANIGDKVEFFGDNATYGVIADYEKSSRISCSLDCYVYGNIMSLINSDDFASADTLSEGWTFNGLFYDNTKIKNKTGYNLLLPATTLTNGCYDLMFCGCTGLTTAPELPATTLASNCYNWMFARCALIEAPVLPATTLATGCYAGMFRDCTSLTTAPYLPATILVSGCYNSMFKGCTNLNSITCLATSISGNNCLAWWLGDVAVNGTFTKAAGMSNWPTGVSGIPEGWTVQDYVA